MADEQGAAKMPEDEAAAAAAAHAAAESEQTDGMDVVEETVEPPVDENVLASVMEMGFGRERAVRALWQTDNNLEHAITWLTEHAEDPDIDTPLMIPKKDTVKLTPEEKKAKLDALLEKTRKEKAKRERELEKQQELDRIRSNKELLEAKRMQDEQQKKLDREREQREKERQKKERERLRAELAKDKAERRAAMGLSAEEETATKEPEDPYKRRMVPVRAALRKIYTANREGPVARGAMTMAGKVVGNIVANPTEDKYRGIRTTNEVVQRNLLSRGGGKDLLAAVGFVEQGDKLAIVGDAEVEWLQKCVDEINTAMAKGPFY